MNYIDRLGKEMTEGKKANIIIKDILDELHGDLGVLYNTKKDLTLEEWNEAGGNEEIYAECKNISVFLYQKASTFDYTKIRK